MCPSCKNEVRVMVVLDSLVVDELKLKLKCAHCGHLFEVVIKDPFQSHPLPPEHPNVTPPSELALPPVPDESTHENKKEEPDVSSFFNDMDW